jgi:sulfur carrier protein
MLREMPDPTTVHLTVNGEPHELLTGTTVAHVVERWCPAATGIAVARNREVVPRSAWAVTALHPGDRVEIVTAAAGG